MIGVHTRRAERDRGADGDIPHDQTDQSACWDAGAAQAGSATPSTAPSTGHKHTGAKPWPPPEGPPLSRCVKVDDIRISHPLFLQDAPKERKGGGNRNAERLCGNSPDRDRAARVTSKSGTPAFRPENAVSFYKCTSGSSLHLSQRRSKNGGSSAEEKRSR